MRQAQALHLLQTGRSVFLTGAPGAGKTYVLNQFIAWAVAHGKRVAVTASTGIAATHIGGTTIHSWSGLGIRDRLNPYDREWLSNNDRLRKRYNSADTLIIDEISMLHGARLDMINEACKLLRENQEPFGGLQVVLVGDLFQLPPVNRLNELVDFAHTSAAWAELDPAICYISEQHRQADDMLLDLLTAMRSGELDQMHIEALQSRRNRELPQDQPITRLFTHNIDVEAINQRHLQAINSETKTFAMQSKGAAAKVEQLVKSVLAPEELSLKVGAEVMFVANDYAQGFVNGSRGRVVEFKDGLPMVELANGRILKVEPHSWTLTEDDRKRAEVVQLPLRLAWAITIHKSQGMSLDAAEIDLSKSFTPGMGYVALSRVRSLDGIYLSGINGQALQLHPAIYEFDRQLQQASSSLADRTPDAADEPESVTGEEATADKPQPTYDEALYDKLKRWRLNRARQDHVAPFMIAHDAALAALASHPPQTQQQLLGIKGFGATKAATFGPDILKTVQEHLITQDMHSTAEDNPDTLLQAPRAAVDAVNSQLLQLLKERQDLVDQISSLKATYDISPHQPGRQQAMMDDIAQQAAQLGLNVDDVTAVFSLLHDQSVARQTAHR